MIQDGLEVRPADPDKEAKLKAAIEKIEAVKEEEHKENLSALDILAKSTRDSKVAIDIPGGSILVWASPSQKQIDEFVRRDDAMAALLDPKTGRVKDKKKFNDLLFQSVEAITVDPLLTAAWLRKNPESFSVQDIKVIYNAYLLMLGQRPMRLARIQKFLQE